MVDGIIGALILPDKVDSSLAPLAWAVLGLPLISFIGGLLIGGRSSRAAGVLATIASATAFGCAIALAFRFHEIVSAGGSHQLSGAVYAFDLSWMSFGDGGLEARFGFLLDPISVMMILVITGISTLVNLYSIGYMAADRSAGRFFPLLSFFSLSMLGLVVAGNLLQTFFFWELVGTASYLLIGFWYEKPEAVAAAKKAFIITRFADALFLLGVLLVGWNAGTFDIEQLVRPDTASALDRSLALGLFSVPLLSFALLCIYAGGWGKSAMFPLHVWLPDAMEGPTPVSSLIHSATMVVAGVFLVARLHPLFSASEAAMQTIEITGAFTALFAAAIACTQVDLKRILAFSTLSQLGYMMFALGVSRSAGGMFEHESAAGGGWGIGYSASMFHVFTHAFAKCLLFLAAGIVIHTIHSNDIREAGGLRRRMPLTYVAAFVACLSLSGVFPFAGYFSKDEILLAAWENGRYVTLAIGLATGALTAFYLFRFLLLTFHGDAREHAHDSHAHTPAVMVIPVLLLAVPSIFAGWLAKDIFASDVYPLGARFRAVDAAAAEHGAGGGAWVPMAALALALAAIALAFLLYGRRGAAAAAAPESAPLFQRLLYRKFYLDEAWLLFARRVMIASVAKPLATLERGVINGAFDAGYGVLRACAAIQSFVHSGRVQIYAGIGMVGLYIIYRIGRGGL